MTYRRTSSLNRSRDHWRQEYASAAAVRKCQAGDAPVATVSRRRLNLPTQEFERAHLLNAVKQPDFPYPFDSSGMTWQQVVMYLWNLSDNPAKRDACIAWNKAQHQRMLSDWQATQAAAAQ